MTEDQIEQRFLRDVANHKITIIRDNGVDRHIRFSKESSNSYYFDLITWGGCLCINGDCGTYVFSRINDMFEFFRPRKSEQLVVNPEYWSEKLLAVNSSGRNSDSGCMEYSEKRFKEAVKYHVDSYFEGREVDFDQDEAEFNATLEAEKAELWEHIRNEVLCAENEYQAHEFARDFEHKNFRFSDFWECRLRDFKHGFIWNLYAIVWGIQQYDRHKEEIAAPLESKY